MTSRIVVTVPPRRSLAGRPRMAAALAEWQLRERSALYDRPVVIDTVRMVRDAVVAGDPLAQATVLVMRRMPGAAAWLDALNRMAFRDRASTVATRPRRMASPGVNRRFAPSRPPAQLTGVLRIPAPWERGGTV